MQSTQFTSLMTMLNTLENAVAAAERAGSVTGDLNERVDMALLMWRANADLPFADRFGERIQSLHGRVTGLASREEAISDRTIRNTFYNIMVEASFLLPELKEREAPLKLAALTVLEAIEQSSGVEGIKVLEGPSVTARNCPAEFQTLVQAILALKSKILALSPAQRDSLKNDLIRPSVALAALPESERSALSSLKGIAEAICSRDTFQEIISNVLAFGQECKGSLVDEALVRDSFYQLMAGHATGFEFISKEALHSREAYIYIALPAHALIEGALISKDLNGAIALLKNETLNRDNCPASYRDLLEAMLSLKEPLAKLSPEQIRMLKFSCVDDDEIPIPAELLELKTPELMALAGRINNVAIQISQLATFKGIIDSVIEFCASA